MRKTVTVFLVFTVLLSSCWDLGRRPNTNPIKVLGYKPVYSTDFSLTKVLSLAPQPVKFAGKIYVKDHLIYQNDLGSGIHIIDNTNPASASRVGFIRVLGNSEISIKGNYLYANSFSDLVVIDISNWQNATEVKRMPHAFTQLGSSYTFIPLPEHRVYYECPDYYTSRVQTGWIKDSIETYSCYYP